MPQIFGKAAGVIERHRGIFLPVVAAGLVLALIVPVPAGLMDVLLSANLALSAVILLTAIYVATPLEFSVLPTVLLVGTLVRLVLNVATTRLVLTAGEGRTPELAQHAAGEVVLAFSAFVPSGSLAVGVILFAILVIVQFIVITKGAGRISEVAARFTLDAMPGKQMAIDSDLNAALITEDQARQRRTAISQEADFYGAMDGASKFLRGDAVASLMIIAINILGGLYVGMVQYGWGWSTSVDLFTRLTIGDGLVTQIPAFIMSIAAALLVTRSTGRVNLGEQMVGQLGSRPVVLGIAAAFLGALMFTSLPKIPLLLLAAGMIGLAWMLTQRRTAAAATAAQAASAVAAIPPAPQSIEKLLTIDPMRIDLGYSLIRLADTGAKGDLLERISSLRAKMAEELGLLIPPVRIRDDMRLDAHSYAIFIRGTKVASGKLYPSQRLAVGGEGDGELIGRTTVEPVFGMAAVWISPSQQRSAEALNYTIIEPSNVLATHLGEVIRSHAADLLTREHLGKLLEHLSTTASHLVSDVTQKLRPQLIQKVLQNLLRERVAIRDLEAILEAMGEGAEHTQDAAGLTEFVRARLARSLSQQYCGDDGRLWCVSLEPALEEVLGRYVSQHASTLPPELNQKIAGAVTEGLWTLQKQGRQPVLLCAPHVRATLSKLLAPVVPRAAVLGYNEVESVDVKSIASIGAEL